MRDILPQIKSRIVMAQAAFNNKKNIFTSKLDKFKEETSKCYIWGTAQYAAENWTLRKVYQKHLKSFEIGCWRKVQKINWANQVRNEEVLHRANEEGNILHTKKKEDSLY
jgi:hypothetical protein